MGFLISLVIGAVCGWLAGIIMNRIMNLKSKAICDQMAFSYSSARIAHRIFVLLARPFLAHSSAEGLIISFEASL